MGRLSARGVHVSVIILLAFHDVTLLQFMTWTQDNSIPSGYNETWTGLFQRPATLVECVSMCQQRSWCLTLAYIPLTLRCRLYNQEVTPDTKLQKPSGPVQFYKALPCLRPDYKYRPQLDTCVKIHNSSWETQGNATSVCKQEGGHLIKVNVTAAYNFMEQVIADTGITEYWLGGNRSVTNIDEHHWVTGEVITSLNGGQFWLPGQPDNTTEKDCIIFTNNVVQRLGMKAVRCDKGRAFVCQRARK